MSDTTTVKSLGVSAILMADMQGYSRLMSLNEGSTLRRVEDAIDFIQRLAEDYGGTIKNIAGDGILAIFDNVTTCVDFAVAMQEEFVKDTVWRSEDEPISFRIGINVGELHEGNFGPQGHAINVAARIQSLAKPGGICISDTVLQVARNLGERKFRSLGKPRLKNITDFIEVFELEPQTEQPSDAHSAADIRSREDDIPDIPEKSVAVLPLENLSGEARNTHICTGVTGDIISNLTRFNDLHVIAQRSADLLGKQQLALEDIGRRLGVRYLMTGGLQTAGNKLRVHVQLTEAESGRSVWSERFNGTIDDIFEFQDEIASVIASCLSIKIDKAERQRQQRTAPSDLKAYGLILRGREVYKRPRRELNLHARRLFEQASHMDPNYAVSYTSISRTSNDAWRFNWAEHPQAALDDAIVKAEEAIKLDPDDARSHAALGNAFVYKRLHDESLAAYERAIQHNPNDADILAEMGHSASVYGDTDRAVELIQRAMRLNPFYPDWYLWHLGEAYFDMSDYDEAIRTLNKMSDKTEAYRMLAASNALLGRMEEARRHAEQILVTHPEFTLKHWADVPPDRNPEPRERLIEGLKRAGLE